MKKGNTIYSAFCGTGKSYLCSTQPDTYKEVECWEYRKGDFPGNYIAEVVERLGDSKYLFVSTDPSILRGLKAMGFEIKLFYPQNELRNEYLDRYLKRDSPYDFIGAVMKYWDSWLDELKGQEYCEHTVLKEGEYLIDVLFK